MKREKFFSYFWIQGTGWGLNLATLLAIKSLCLCCFLQVNTNGVISFDNSFTSCCPRSFPRLSPPLIAPYWHDFNPSISGRILYRLTGSANQLQMFDDLYLSLDRGKDLPDLVPTVLFVATWDQVPQFNGRAQVRNNVLT